jgi:hypothetical protein
MGPRRFAWTAGIGRAPYPNGSLVTASRMPA